MGQVTRAPIRCEPPRDKGVESCSDVPRWLPKEPVERVGRKRARESLHRNLAPIWILRTELLLHLHGHDCNLGSCAGERCIEHAAVLQQQLEGCS